MRLLSVLGASQALGDHLVPAPRALARAHRPDPRLHPPGGVRRARRTCCGRSAPTRDDAAPDRDRCRTRGGGRAAGGVPPAAAPARRPRPGPPPRRRRRGRRALRPRRRHPRGGAGDRPAAASARTPRRARLAVVAMGKCGGHELNYVSDVDVIFVVEPAEGADEAAAAARVATQLASPPDADLLRAHRRGHDLAGRRQPAARGQGRAAGAHPGQPPRLLRALGQDLGVPGAAQGPPGRRRPRRSGRQYVDRGRADGVAGGRARRASSTDVQAMRRRVRRAHPGPRGRAAAQARLRRAARRRVRRPAAPARARPRRRAAPRRRRR